MAIVLVITALTSAVQSNAGEYAAGKGMLAERRGLGDVRLPTCVAEWGR